MALTIYENKEEATPASITADRRLFTDAGGRIVEDGDPAACMLYASPGKRIGREDFEARGGVVEDEPEGAPQPEPEPEPEPTPKAKPKAKAKAKATKKGK